MLKIATKQERPMPVKQTITAERFQASANSKQFQFDRSTFRSVLRTHRRLNEAIRSAVKYELLAKEITHKGILAQHPATRREVFRRSCQDRDRADIRRKREWRKLFYDLKRLARRWHARFLVAPNSWLLQRDVQEWGVDCISIPEKANRKRERIRRRQSAK